MSTTLRFDSRRTYSPRNFAAGLIEPEPQADPLGDLCVAFQLGYMFGLQGRQPLPPSDFPPMLVDAFYDGLADGELDADERNREAYLDELERLRLQVESCDYGADIDFDVLRERDFVIDR